MQDWFTAEYIDDTTVAISEYAHWEQAHSYLLIGRHTALLVDTGLGIGNIRDCVQKLTHLPVIVATTHVHWDHIGGHGLFEDIGVHPADAHRLTHGLPLPLEMIRRELVRDVAPQRLPEGFDAGRYVPYTGAPSRLLGDGGRLELGGRSVEVLHTPGHSPGHICLWEAQRGYLYTGDLLYGGTLYAHYPSTDPAAYRASVTRAAALPGLKRLLPAHHSLDIPVSLAARARDAFDAIHARGLLHHGGGTFDHGDFSIQI